MSATHQQPNAETATRPDRQASVLRCPSCATPFAGASSNRRGGGLALKCASCGRAYPIKGGVARFVESEKYVESFGVEWKEFPRAQLDSANGTRISRYRFEQLAGVAPSALAGKRVLEVGCGMGRFLDVLAEAGAQVWGVDLSLAAEVAAENTRRHPNCRVVQADLFEMPFGEDFDFIYSFGVLHHTPDPRAALAAVARHLRPGGRLAVWVYGRGVTSGLKSRRIPRPYQIYGALFKRLPPRARKRALNSYARLALAAGSVPLLGTALRHVLPIQDLRRRGPRQDGYEPAETANAEKRERLRLEWARHSAFDMFTPQYVAQYDAEEVAEWARAAGLSNVEVGEVPTTVRATRPEAVESGGELLRVEEKTETPRAEESAENLNAEERTNILGVKERTETLGVEERAEKLHVLFFVSRLNGGGAEMHLLRVMNYLDRARFRVSLAVTRPSGSFESSLAEDVRLHVLDTGGRDSSTLRMARAVGPLRRLIREERPAVVCSVMELANIVNVLASRGVAPRPKIVLGVQTPPSIALRHTWHPVNRLSLRLIPRLYPQADRVVALSRGVAEDIGALAPGVGSRAEVIHNAGVEESVLEKMREPLTEEENGARVPTVVACGRLKSLKGFNYLIDALAEVRRTTPARLWIVGEGEERANLEKQIARLGLQDSVRLLGFQPNPFKYMAAADVFVLSSLFEGFGNVIVEAMACGTPVVATDCPYGPADIISDGENGLLVPPADAASLAAALLRVLTDEELRRKLSLKGKERSEHFHARTIAGEYAGLFAEVVGANGERRTK